MSHYDVLLDSDNYVTKRRSLKLLGELLLDRKNFSVMLKYIASKHNLKTIMNLLRDKSLNIQFEAFQVFKVFVANPKKPVEVTSILYKNREKMIPFLEAFHIDKEDQQFIDEKRLIIETLEQLENPEPIISTTDTTTNSNTTTSDDNTSDVNNITESLKSI